jgi:hypothetical protein
MHFRHPAQRRDHQVNIRFTAAEIADLEAISEVEDRDRSYLVAWFTRWGMEQYRRAGSLSALKSTKMLTSTQIELASEIISGATGRLELRKGAAAKYEERAGHSRGSSTKVEKIIRKGA